MRCACQDKPSGEGITERRVKIAIACGAYLSDDWDETFLDRVDRKVVRCHPAFLKSGVSQVTYCHRGAHEMNSRGQAAQSMAWQRDAAGGHVAPERDTQGQHSTGTPCEEALVHEWAHPFPLSCIPLCFAWETAQPAHSPVLCPLPPHRLDRRSRGAVHPGTRGGGRDKAGWTVDGGRLAVR